MTGIPTMTTGRTMKMTMRATGMMTTVMTAAAMTEIGMTTINAEKFPTRPWF